MIKILVISDTHIGSVYALASPSSIPRDRENEFLKWIHVCWLNLCKKHYGPDYLLSLGDLADGPQVKNLGVDALVTDTDEQVRMAVDLLSRLTSNDTVVFGVNGSDYHTGTAQATTIDRRILEGMGGKYKGPIFEFEVGNPPIRIQAAHGGSAPIVGTHTYLLREMLQSEKDAAKNNTKGPDIIIRAHQHRFFSVQDDNGVWGVLNGCWQYITPFMARKSANITPSIGATIIEVDKGIAKIYREEYKIPSYVREDMCNYSRLGEKHVDIEKVRNTKEIKKTLKLQHAKDSQFNNKRKRL